MGRTGRRRRKRAPLPDSLDADNNIIELKKWMASRSWSNVTQLQLRNFKTTGRGVCSSKNIQANGVLIEVPYQLLITPLTVARSALLEILKPSSKLSFHSCLAAFVVLEKHHVEGSPWEHYLNSLPETAPRLPWLCSTAETETLPEEVKLPTQRASSRFEESWEGVRKSIRPTWRCYRCGERGDRVLKLNTFAWAYVMVNTRAVFVDPRTLAALSADEDDPLGDLLPLLSDEPRMALCPYLDMFNHSSVANAEAALEKIDGRWVFRLTTAARWGKNEQIFISYGCHNNIKLLTEYGFFTPGNELDCVVFTLSEVLEGLNLQVDGRQYRFLRDRNLDKDLHVGPKGLSFALKAVLFVALKNEARDWCEVIYSERYPEGDSLKMESLSRDLLARKRTQSLEALGKLTNYLSENASTSDGFLLVVEFWTYWTSFIENLLSC